MINKIYNLKDKDELVLTGKQLREWKIMIEQEIKDKEIGFLEDFKENIRSIWMKSVEDSSTRFYLNLIEKKVDKRLQELKK